VRDLLEILDDRYDRRSTLMTSQLPVDQWHAYLGDRTVADAILDRLVHNSYSGVVQALIAATRSASIALLAAASCGLRESARHRSVSAMVQRCPRAS